MSQPQKMAKKYGWRSQLLDAQEQLLIAYFLRCGKFHPEAGVGG
jgi:hypothetical protein